MKKIRESNTEHLTHRTEHWTHIYYSNSIQNIQNLNNVMVTKSLRTVRKHTERSKKKKIRTSMTVDIRNNFCVSSECSWKSDNTKVPGVPNLTMCYSICIVCLVAFIRCVVYSLKSLGEPVSSTIHSKCWNPKEKSLLFLSLLSYFQVSSVERGIEDCFFPAPFAILIKTH